MHCITLVLLLLCAYRAVRTLHAAKVYRAFMESLSELMVRVLCDEDPKDVDAIYSFPQTLCNEEAQIKKLHELSMKYRHAVIIYSGEDGSRSCGWAGYRRFEERLKITGVSSSRLSVVPFPETEKRINTLNESIAVVDFCSSHAVRKLLVVAPPFHQTRCTMTILSCVAKTMGQIDIYSAPSLADGWQKQVYHSQGILFGSRASLVRAELLRIWSYHLKGDLVSPDVAINILNNRRYL